MRTKPLRERSTLKNALTYLETLRPRLVDLEAMAHAAGQMLGELPYLKTADEEVRRNFGRLHSLVSTTASTARDVLDEHAELLARAYEDEDLVDLDLGDDDPEDPDSGPDDAGPGGDEPAPPVGAGGSQTSAAARDLDVPRSLGSRGGGIVLDTKIYPSPVR
jgi:hypothetical protein